MAKAADTGGAGSPFVKFVDLGDRLVGAFGSSPRECKRQARNFDTGNPATRDDGRPVWEEVLHFIAMPGTTAKTGSADSGWDSIAEGDEVRFSVQGYKWGQVIDGRKNLPPYAGFKAGQACSGDVYTIRLVGWSAETKNAQAAQNAGFTVVDGRIVLRTQEEKDRYILAQSRSGGNTNPAKDYEFTIRRPNADEKRWEQAADELFDRKPWARTPATVGGGSDEHQFGDADPFCPNPPRRTGRRRPHGTAAPGSTPGAGLKS